MTPLPETNTYQDPALVPPDPIPSPWDDCCDYCHKPLEWGTHLHPYTSRFRDECRDYYRDED